MVVIGITVRALLRLIFCVLLTPMSFNVTDRPATYDFLLTFHSIHATISYRFQDKRRFLWKIADFSYPRVFIVPDGGFTLEYGKTGWPQ